MTPKQKSIGKLISEARSELGKENGQPVSWYRLAAQLNAPHLTERISYQNLYAWEHGKLMPSLGRAKFNYVVAPRDSWQRAFWRSIILTLNPEDELLKADPVLVLE